MRLTPIKSIIDCMEVDSNVKYVGILMRSNLLYLEQFAGKYGVKQLKLNQGLAKRPEELLLDPKIYGRNDAIAHELCGRYKQSVNDKYTVLLQNYKNSVPYKPFLTSSHDEMGRAQASLIPTLFWYDNVHVARRSHYKDFVFDPKLKLVARGGFVEDKLSPALVKCVDNVGLESAIEKFGCYLFDDHCGVAFTGHLDGGSFLTEEQREGRKEGWKDENKKEEREGKGVEEVEGMLDSASIFGGAEGEGEGGEGNGGGKVDRIEAET